MFVKEVQLFHSPLSLYLRQELSKQEAAVTRLSDLSALSPERIARWVQDVRVPTLLRHKAEFDLREDDEEVVVRVKVPVTGDVQLLQYTPEGHEHLRTRAKITDDLEQGADRQGDSYSSDTFEDVSVLARRHSGMVLTKKFHGTATAEEIRAWARELLNSIESKLPAMSDQVAQHMEQARTALTRRADARSSALRTTGSLTKELGIGI